MKHLMVIAAAALALASCGPRADRDGRFTVKGTDGTVITAGKQLPASLPTYAKLYPGARLTSTVDMGGRGGIVTYTVDAPPETVMDFHKRAAAEGKLGVEMDSWASGAQERSGAHVVAFKDEGRDAGLTATVQRAGGETQVTLIYGGH